MEGIQATCLPIWTALLSISAVLLYVYSTWTHNVFKKLGVKGPKPYPLIGNMAEIFQKAPTEIDVSHTKAYGKVHGIFNGLTPILIVGDPEMVKEITVKQFGNFVNRTQFRNFQRKPLDRSVSVLSDDHWRHVRASISPTFTSGKLKEMLGTINDCSSTLVRYLDKQNGKPMDTKTMLAGFTMDVIAGTAFGLDVKTLENPDSPFIKHAQHFFSFASLRSPKRTIAITVTFMSEKLAVLLEKIGFNVFEPEPVEYITNVVKKALEGRGSPGGRKDFAQLCMSQLVDIDKVNKESLRETGGLQWTTEGLLTDDIVSNAIIFLLAGYDTTSTFLNFFCYSMAIYPEIQKKLHDDIVESIPSGEVNYEKLKDIVYLDWCIDETFRMFPPAFRLDRKCNEDTTIGGIRIPAGMTVNIPVYAMHHDEDYWPEPHVFRPERFSPEEKDKQHQCAYLPFGSGPRNCIGMRLALLEIKTVIVKLMRRYEIIPSEGTPRAPLKFKVGFGFLTPENPIMLSFKPRPVAPL